VRRARAVPPDAARKCESAFRLRCPTVLNQTLFTALMNAQRRRWPPDGLVARRERETCSERWSRMIFQTGSTWAPSDYIVTCADANVLQENPPARGRPFPSPYPFFPLWKLSGSGHDAVSGFFGRQRQTTFLGLCPAILSGEWNGVVLPSYRPKRNRLASARRSTTWTRTSRTFMSL